MLTTKTLEHRSRNTCQALLPSICSLHTVITAKTFLYLFVFTFIEKGGMKNLSNRQTEVQIKLSDKINFDKMLSDKYKNDYSFFRLIFRSTYTLEKYM